MTRCRLESLSNYRSFFSISFLSQVLQINCYSPFPSQFTFITPIHFRGKASPDSQFLTKVQVKLKILVSMESLLVRKCLEAATESPAAVEKWRRQRRTLERMPSHLAETLLHYLLRRRLLFPSLLEYVYY